MAVPSDVAAAVLFLAFDLGSFVSGYNLMVDRAATVRSPFNDQTF